MNTLNLHRLWTWLCGLDRASLLLLLGAIVVAIALVVLIRTRWGHSHSLEKCALFSILVHVLLTGYAATVQIVTYRSPPKEQFIRIALVDGPVGAEHGRRDGDDPLAVPERMPPKTESIPAAVDRKEVKAKSSDIVDAKPQAKLSAAMMPRAAAQVPEKQLMLPPAVSAAAQDAIRQISHRVSAISEWRLSENAQNYLKDLGKLSKPETSTAATNASIPIVTITPSTPDSSTPASASTAAPSPTAAVAAGALVSFAAGKGDSATLADPLRGGHHEVVGARIETGYPVGALAASVPEAYKLRLATDHVGLALAGGGSKETEAAVQAALKWLAEHQSRDGRWEARRNEAGRETTPDGRSRPNAGADADTGMTGLALLAMLGAGNTHERGQYQESVRSGLNFLLQSQDGDGCLSGTADRYAAMYCHAIAAFALGEAYGMTRERRLEEPLRRAVGYTVAAQDPYGGGWRYRPHDAGDTSQLGWQFMALKSADLAGIAMPDATRQGIIRYLQSVALGQHGGLASYRPMEAPSRTMTAEAMLCWQFLGLAREHPACDEASGYVLSAPPGVGTTNFYYWYYGTLVMYQFQGDGWQRWNTAVATQLVGLQNKQGPQAGSWDPDSAWGGYGGRVYSTALGAMCLEVYYRFLPVYRK